MMRMKGNRLQIGLKIAAIALPMMALIAAVVTLVTMNLWNWLLPPLFGWHAITFWQAVGILALCRILFGRIGGRGFQRSRFRGRLAERWERMTPEERERFRQGMRGRCGFGTPASESKESGGSQA